MALEIKIRLAKLPEILKPGKANQIFRGEFMKAINTSNVIVRAKMVAASPFGGTNSLRKSWQIVPAVPKGNSIVGATRSVGPGAIAAVVLDDGATPHFPPVGPTGEAALATWIRRGLPRVAQPFIVENGKEIPADVNNPEHVRKIAYAIGRAIKRRGFPRPGKQKDIFTRVFRSLTPDITAIMEAAGVRIQTRFQVGR